MGPAPRQVVAGPPWPLHDVAATRSLEAAALAATPAHALMQRAGLACARLAMALVPHARTIWVAAGPGNNGGDGMEAAMHLHQWGCNVVVTLLGNPDNAPADAQASQQRALQAGVRFADDPPPQWDLCIDALLGIGATRAPQTAMARWIGEMLRGDAPVLAIDNPTGLDADTGQAASVCVKAMATLSLLTLKPGLFTADGRDMAGQVWFDDLQGGSTTPSEAIATSASAYLNGRPTPTTRRHASHKGSYGDVAVVGGAPGMGGAALLAACASLHAGAGRVYLCALDPAVAMALVPTQPELMLRDIGALDVAQMTVVCGCGGGDAVREHLPRLVSGAGALVLDADALNAIATDSQLQQQLANRSMRQAHAVLTPHPLEAARLLGTTAREVQADRLHAARALSQKFRCTVVLKGSGSIITAPQHLPAINPTGNAYLATAGTGDVLAGLIGARLAAGMPAFEAACASAFQHGDLADRWPADAALTAAALAGALR